MKATGIVRRIDDLGRVVIPKEIRRTLRIREGDPLEIYTEESQMVLRKYSPMNEGAINAIAVANSLNSILEKGVVITDNDEVIAVSGVKEVFASNEISNSMVRAIKDRKNIISSRADGGTILPIVKGGQAEVENQVVVPVLANGDCYGAVILLDYDKNYRFTMNEVKLAKLGANFLASQFEE